MLVIIQVELNLLAKLFYVCSNWLVDCKNAFVSIINYSQIDICKSYFASWITKHTFVTIIETNFAPYYCSVVLCFECSDPKSIDSSFIKCHLLPQV